MKIFNLLTQKEKSEALQCLIKNIEVHSNKLLLNIYELNDFNFSSQKSLHWWSYRGSNSRPPDCLSGVQ